MITKSGLVWLLWWFLWTKIHLKLGLRHLLFESWNGSLVSLLLWWFLVTMVIPGYYGDCWLLWRFLWAKIPVSIACFMRRAVVISVVHVLWEGAGVTESFTTLLTLERFLTTVKALMFGEMVLVFERLGAHVTGKWTGSWKG